MTVKFYPEDGDDILVMSDGTYRFRNEVNQVPEGIEIIYVGTPEYDDALEEMGY